MAPQLPTPALTPLTNWPNPPVGQLAAFPQYQREVEENLVRSLGLPASMVASSSNSHEVSLPIAEAMLAQMLGERSSAATNAHRPGSQPRLMGTASFYGDNIEYRVRAPRFASAPEPSIRFSMAHPPHFHCPSCGVIVSSLGTPGNYLTRRYPLPEDLGSTDARSDFLTTDGSAEATLRNRMNYFALPCRCRVLDDFITLFRVESLRREAGLAPWPPADNVDSRRYFLSYRILRSICRNRFVAHVDQGCRRSGYYLAMAIDESWLADGLVPSPTDVFAEDASRMLLPLGTESRRILAGSVDYSPAAIETRMLYRSSLAPEIRAWADSCCAWTPNRAVTAAVLLRPVAATRPPAPAPSIQNDPLPPPTLSVERTGRRIVFREIREDG